MNSYRITKYNPKLRDRMGSYLPDEWTSVGDIGKQFPSGELSIADYLATEEQYVNSVLYLWQLAQRPPLCITDLEARNFRTNKARLVDLPELLDIVHEPIPKKNGLLLCDPVIVARVVRLILRELIWCKLEAKTGLYFHFGWDYYMYFGGEVALSAENCNSLSENCLFVEDFRSPYSKKECGL